MVQAQIRSRHVQDITKPLVNPTQDDRSIEITTAIDSIDTSQEIERWDDAFDLDEPHALEHLFDQLRRHLPRSPLSDNSDQGDYFQLDVSSRSVTALQQQQLQHLQSLTPPTTPGSRPSNSLQLTSRRRTSFPTYTHALPSPPTTTTATTLMSSRSILASRGSDSGTSHNSFQRLVDSTAEACISTGLNFMSSNSFVNGKTDAAGGNHGPTPASSARGTVLCVTDTSSDKGLSKKKLSMPSSTSSSPASSTSSTPSAISTSFTAPSTVVTTRGLLLQTDKDKRKDKSHDENPSVSIKAMTTITQEMMQSNLPAYTGIITRINPINPIKRVAAWVDDLEDLEVPEGELNFNHVRSILEKSSSTVVEALESADSWDTDSENSASRSDDFFSAGMQLKSLPLSSIAPQIRADPAAPPMNSLRRSGDSGNTRSRNIRSNVMSEPDTIETLDDDFDFPEDFGSLRLHTEARRYERNSTSAESSLLKRQSSLLQWQDSGSDMDEFDFSTPLDNDSVSSIASLSKDSIDDESFLDGIIFPEAMESLQLVTNRPYRPETEPSIFGKESYFLEDQDDFWDGLDIGGDDAFNRKNWNKNVIVRAVPLGRERSGSRVQREVVPLKDFVALPSRIPRLCRAPGDTSRPVTPAPSLSRMHSTQFELPLRNLKSKSSLPRLKRTSVSKRDGGARSSLIFLGSDAVLASSDVSSTYSSPLASRAPTPTISNIPASKRNSLLQNKDGFPTFKRSSLAIRSVSFNEPTEAPQQEEPMPTTSLVLSPPSSLPPIEAKAAASSRSNSKGFPSLRMLVKKLDFARPRFSTRGLIPVFEPAAPPKITCSAEQPHFTNHEDESRAKASKVPHSRSSSYTDWSSILASTETTRESRSPSRAGLVSLGGISEVSTTDIGESVTPVAATDRFSRRLFLKRSPKHSMFGDGSELDRFDNLPTYGPQELYEDERARVTVLAAQARRQSTDRVAAWLRKPQSIANFKDVNKTEAKTNEQPDSNSLSKIRKSKSIRRSLFDIFGQNTGADQLKDKEEKGKSQRKRRKMSNGPTLIRDLSQSRVRKVSGMIYNPKDKMWDGNDDILDDFEDDQNTSTPHDAIAPVSPSSHSYLPAPSLLGVNRPALISNMSQYTKQRTQVAGKMIFDPTKMCWVVNPEYISRRLRQKQTNYSQRSLDEAWGDEPDIFAGLSDSDLSQGEQEGDDDRGQDREDAPRASVGRSKSHRLLSRPSFRRYPTQERLEEGGHLRPCPETMNSALANEPVNSRPTSVVIHSIVSKSSRKSLNGTHSNGYSNGMSGGGYSSRGEFEVGVEFDITDAFLEQCIAAESQHRKDAGKFFALPCTPAVAEPNPIPSGPLSKMRSSKVLSLGKRSSKPKTPDCLKENEETNGNHPDMTQKGRKGKEKADDSLPGTERTSDCVIIQNNKMEKNTDKSLTPFQPKKPVLSWPPRNKSKSRSIIAYLQDEQNTQGSPGQIESSSNQKSSTWKRIKGSSANSSSENSTRVACKDKSKGKSKDKNKDKSRKSFGRVGLLPFASTYSSTSSAAPAAATLAARGRGGPDDVHFHRLPSKHDSICGTLSFSATLAVARRGPLSHDRRRIGNHTFDPVNTHKRTDGDGDEEGSLKENISPDADQVDEDDDWIERGYRVMSRARGRPPLFQRTELLQEFERHTGQRYQ
ncbi:hypothetical protein BX616_004307 [Lobosporangium transversale]|uniref:Uncharacterized protein n=1 Tax=Lobosporangium transversale TaxID=64571 RepID=A0A1Y2GA51_9FUNG|nr:hypothetical protein BCR41DRAFT_361885 [Lobosporangium transversale]KAF9916226.1 hypothetical protein BX616_004307 [Lobosporangium transversale]ORZ05317.1 hypothetical protein BCR41DRAFT_361885 [Lobosporangium transversale]|eukprot:XP_021877009.1 hypothetical protein BCR41DRAFT_361885 [Lobosporangium transversale]